MLTVSKIQDPRTGWDMFRRKELEYILKLERITFTHGMPATSLRRLLIDSGIDAIKYRPARLGPLYGDIGRQEYRYPKIDENLPDISDEVIDESFEAIIEDVNVYDLKMPALRKFCKEHGIKALPSLGKKDLYKLIEAKINGQNVT